MTVMHHTPSTRGIILLATLLLTGCVTATPYERPETPAGFAWKADSVTAEKQSMSEPWWVAFNDEGLNRLVPVVLAANNDILGASLRARRALLEAGLADNEALPVINGSTNAQRTKTFDGELPAASRFGSTLALSYELDLWGRISARRDSARLEAEASTADIASARLSVIAATVSTWWRIAHANQMIASAERGLGSARRTAALVATMRAAETVSDLESLEAEETIQSQLANIERLKGGREAQRIALKVLLNGSEMPALEPTRLPPAKLPEIAAGLPASIVARRPDMQAAELRLRSVLRQVDEKQASFYPQISLTGDLGTNGRQLAELLSNPVGTLGANMALPFLNIRQAALDFRVSKARYAEAVNGFRGTLLTALSEVSGGLASRQSLARERARLSSAFSTQKKIEGLYETRFRAGSIDLRSFIEVQERTRQRESALIDNQLERLLSEATLYRALGGLPSGSLR